jgi:hypothetical protein
MALQGMLACINCASRSAGVLSHGLQPNTPIHVCCAMHARVPRSQNSLQGVSIKNTF